jgi:hypothetical protein
MAPHIQHTTVELSPFPDLVVIYLGMKVRNLRGLRTMISFGPKITPPSRQSPKAFSCTSLLFSLLSLRTGMRQYGRDFQSLENWARSLPH